jgi:hypothetical protein
MIYIGTVVAPLLYTARNFGCQVYNGTVREIWCDVKLQ